MKKYFILSGALALAAVTSQAQPQLVIKEVNEGIVATYGGSPISPTITGATDGWTIQLPAGFALSPNIVGGLFDLGEPENANEYNQVAITQPDFLTWDSDIAGAGTAPPFPLTSITIVGAGTFVSAAGGTETFDLVLSDELSRSVPETASTAALLGLAAAGLLVAAKRRAAFGLC
jgi:hypothetical protein